METICHVHWLGRQPYQSAWDLQNRLAAEIAVGERPPTLLLLEHPHTYTFGRRGQPENLLWDAAECARRGVEVVWVDRGGDVTYHGPGQLVGYPLLPLAPPQAVAQASDSARLPQHDYVGYLRRLEQVLIATLASFGVAAVQIPGLTGVWVNVPGVSPGKTPGEAQGVSPEKTPGDTQGEAPGPAPAKIAAIGVKVDARGVTRHGFALNINTDPVYWQGIIGCGLAGHGTANLVDVLTVQPEAGLLPEAGVLSQMGNLRQTLADAFGKVFGYQMVWLDFTL